MKHQGEEQEQPISTCLTPSPSTPELSYIRDEMARLNGYRNIHYLGRPVWVRSDVSIPIAGGDIVTLPNYLYDKEAAMRVFNNLSGVTRLTVVESILKYKHAINSTRAINNNLTIYCAILNFTALDICCGIMDAFGLKMPEEDETN